MRPGWSSTNERWGRSKEVLMFQRAVFGGVLIAGFLVAATAVHADSYADLKKAKAAFEGARSWHAVERISTGQTVRIDHLAPDRWRIQLQPNVTEILVGSDMYIEENGRTIHLPTAMPQIQQMVNRDWLEVQPEVRSTLRDLGMQSFNGAMLHEYTFTSKGYPVQLYLGRRDYPAASVVQTPNGTVTTTYSRYNAPLTISP